MTRKKTVFDFQSFIIGLIVGVCFLVGVRVLIQNKTSSDQSVTKANVITETSGTQTDKKRPPNLFRQFFTSLKEKDAQYQEVRDSSTEISEKEVQQSPDFVIGKIAIIVDDWGYTTRNCHFMKEITAPFAVAILPNLPHTSDIAQCAQDYNKQIMLHLPMEPNYTADRYPKDYLLKTTMSESKVNEILDEIFVQMPWIQGVNNHMGSRATSDKRLMRIILENLKSKKVFFVDSLVTNTTVASSIAEEISIPFASRDIFLDNLNRRSEIEAQFVKAAQIAKRNGSAILIGHDRPLTMQIIKEQSKKLNEQGFLIVPIQELLTK